jgi:hypothetical protein
MNTQGYRASIGDRPRFTAKLLLQFNDRGVSGIGMVTGYGKLELPALCAQSLILGASGITRCMAFLPIRHHGLLPQQLTAMDRLAYIGDRGVGALSYAPASEYAEPTQNRLTEIALLGESAIQLFDGQTNEVLAALAQAGHQASHCTEEYRASLAIFQEWCRKHCRLPKEKLFAKLNAKLRGYNNYCGIRGNYASLKNFYYHVRRIFFKTMNRRSQRRSYNWKGFTEMLKVFKFQQPRICHSF